MCKLFFESDLGNGITGHLIINDFGEVIGIASNGTANIDYESPTDNNEDNNQQIPIEGEL